MPERTVNLDTRRAKPTELVVDAGGGCFYMFSLAYYFFFFLSYCLWKTARHRLKYCHKMSLNSNPSTTNQPFFPLKTNNPNNAMLYLPFAPTLEESVC